MAASAPVAVGPSFWISDRAYSPEQMEVVSRTAAHRRRAHGTQAVLEPWGIFIAYTTQMMLFTYPQRPTGRAGSIWRRMMSRIPSWL